MPQGPTAVATFGQNPAGKSVPSMVDAQSAGLNTQRHGKYYQSALSAGMHSGGNQAGAALSVGLAVTYVGLCLSNPAASGVNLAIKRVSGMLIVAPAAEDALGLITGWAAGGITAHTTPLNDKIVNGLIGSATASLANLDAACTLVGTPLWNRWLVAMPTASTFPTFVVDIDDAIIIPPGGYAAIGALGAGGAAGFLGSFEWEELPPVT